MKRRIRMVLLFLLLGVATNIIVAWSVALLVEPRSVWGMAGRYQDGGRFDAGPLHPYFAWGISEYSTPAALQIDSFWYDPDLSINLDGYWPEAAPEPLVPAWAPFMAPPQTPTSGQEHLRFLEVRGWPMRSMWSLGSYDGPTTNVKSYVITHGIPLPRLGWSRAQALPLGIRWLSFVANSVFYALIWWVLSTARLAFPSARRMRRIKRGLCPACAYPVGASDLCTECGKPVRPGRLSLHQYEVAESSPTPQGFPRPGRL